jgi:hypothetical protein
MRSRESASSEIEHNYQSSFRSMYFVPKFRTLLLVWTRHFGWHVHDISCGVELKHEI